MRALTVLVFGIPLGCFSPTIDLGANDSGKSSDSGASSDAALQPDSGSPLDSGCGSDCRTTNCAPPSGLCSSTGNIGCDPATGNWVCVPLTDAGPVDGGGVCNVGQDWTCNDDPTMQAYAGRCLAGGACSCNPGFMIDPATGRCQVQPADAGCGVDCRTTNCGPPIGLCPTQDTIACDPATGNWVCFPPADAGLIVDGGSAGCYPPGNNGNCNGDIVNASEGTCQPNGQCICNCFGTTCYHLGAGGLCYGPMDYPDGGLDAGPACAGTCNGLAACQCSASGGGHTYALDCSSFNQCNCLEDGAVTGVATVTSCSGSQWLAACGYGC